MKNLGVIKNSLIFRFSFLLFNLLLCWLKF